MINPNNAIRIEKFKCRNLYADIFIPVMRRPGYRSDTLCVHPVVYAYQTGLSGTPDQVKLKLQTLFQKLNAQNILYIVLNDKLSFKPEQTLVQKVKLIFKNEVRSSTDLQTILKLLMQDPSICKALNQPNHRAQLTTALIETVMDFQAEASGLNNSKLINLIVKLLYWFETYLIEPMTKMSSVLTKQSMNPKLIHFGTLTGQDGYILTLGQFLGFDCIHFSYENDDTSSLTAGFRKKAQYFQFEQYSDRVPWKTILLPTNTPQTQSVPSTNTTSQKSPTSTVSKIKPTPTRSSIDLTRHPHKKPLKKDNIQSQVLIKSKKFEEQIDTLLAPLSDRIGYAGEPAPIIPVYFVRYIGTDHIYGNYRNRIYRWHQKCAQQFTNYIKFEGSIRIGNYSDLNSKTSSVWKQYTSIQHEDLSELVGYLSGVSAFDFIKDSVVRNQTYVALLHILKLAFHSGANVPTSKVKNLVIKLIGWLRDHSDPLFRNFTYEKLNNPKVLYYGDIKAHEALFLIFLYQLGVDVLYIHTFHDNVFEALDPDSNFSTVKVLDEVQPLESFPVTETMVQQDTVAFQASEDIAQIIHNDQDGVYKPWQFEAYNIMPVTLRTTYEEFHLLWKEDARIRAGFKVENKTVYVPNLFVKISGTQDDLAIYWKEVSALTQSPLTEFYTRLPFSHVNYDNHSLFSLDTAFENHTTLKFERLCRHPHYKYGHLNTDTQSLIFDKLKMLLHSDIIKSHDEHLQLKVLMTVLNLDDTILRLIQNFDYPASVPKIVIYDPDETTFSESDAITMAFLYFLGFDICVLTPTGYNNFEMYINEAYYHVYKLTQKQFNLALPDLNRYSTKKSKGFWEGLFG